MKKIKQIVHNFVKKILDVKRSKNFDLSNHIAMHHDFHIHRINDDFTVYVKSDDNKLLFFLNKKSKYVELVHNKRLVSKYNFIPESPLVIDVFINLTLKNLA